LIARAAANRNPQIPYLFGRGLDDWRRRGGRRQVQAERRRRRVASCRTSGLPVRTWPALCR